MVQTHAIIQCFQENSKIYGRTQEIEQVEHFLGSKNSILHITGCPGSGKTFTVLKILENRSFLYLNYYNNDTINLAIKEYVNFYNPNKKDSTKLINCSKKKEKIIVIDEFDKYLQEKKKECLKNIILLKSKNIKLITISNDLRMGNIRFLPYSTSELKFILKEKMENELKEQVIDDVALMYLIKKHGKNGDLRAILKRITDVFSQKNEQINNRLKIGDVIEKVENCTLNGIHHELIHKIKEESFERCKAFQNYIKECKSISISHLEKNDFDVIYDML